MNAKDHGVWRFVATSAAVLLPQTNLDRKWEGRVIPLPRQLCFLTDIPYVHYVGRPIEPQKRHGAFCKLLETGTRELNLPKPMKAR